MSRRQPSATQRFATWSGAILGILCALFFLAAQGEASDRGRYTEEFHQTYPLSANGRISLNNIDGAVHITAWDRNEVKVDAVKSANEKERLDETKIEIHAGSDYVEIETKYRDSDLTFEHNSSGHGWGRDGWNNPASVEYTVTVPRNARLDEIELVNGPLDIQGITGEVHASCVNGHLLARGLQGRVELSSVNGRLEAQFDRVGDSSIELSSVNGGLEVTLPSDVKARLEASTVSGGIEDDFGMHVRHHQFVGHSLEAELGGGGTRIELSNVNGRIEIRHANDGRALSPAKDLGRSDKDDDDDDQI
jgi:DUF4097 and DUF4098 domain-containing protein YvlB